MLVRGKGLVRINAAFFIFPRGSQSRVLIEIYHFKAFYGRKMSEMGRLSMSSCNIL